MDGEVACLCLLACSLAGCLLKLSSRPVRTNNPFPCLSPLFAYLPALPQVAQPQADRRDRRVIPVCSLPCWLPCRLPWRFHPPSPSCPILSHPIPSPTEYLAQLSHQENEEPRHNSTLSSLRPARSAGALAWALAWGPWGGGGRPLAGKPCVC